MGLEVFFSPSENDKYMIKNIVKLVIFCAFLLVGNQVFAMDIVDPNTHCYCQCVPIDANLQSTANLPTGQTGTTNTADDDVDEVVEGDENVNDELGIKNDAGEIGEGDVLISEFVSDPVSGEFEWVELYNASDDDIDLSLLVLEEGSGKKTLLEGVLGSGEYIAVEKNSLNNGGDLIVVKTVDGEVIDQVVYGDFDDGDEYDNAPVASDPFSVIRRNVEEDYNIDFQDFVVTEVVTFGFENDFSDANLQNTTNTTNTTNTEDDDEVDEEQDDTSDEVDDVEEILNDVTSYSEVDGKLIITEVFPNPEGADGDNEYVEICNVGDEDINLKGLKIDDEYGGSSPFEIVDEVVLVSGGYYSVYNDQSRIILNNSQDSVRILSSDDIVVDQVDYDDVEEGFAYTLIDGEWLWIETLTPGEENYQIEIAKEKSSGNLIASAMAMSIKKSSTVKTYEKVDLKNVRSFPKNTKVHVSGIISLPPDVFGGQVAYLQGSGIQLYFSKADWPKLVLGDFVEVKGKLSESNGESRILISAKEDITVIEQGLAVSAVDVVAEDISESKEGYLVKIVGQIVDKKTGKLVLADETGEFVVYFKKNTGFVSSIYQVGDEMTVTGIVSQYNNEYRVIPRFDSDVVVVEVEVEEKEIEVLGASSGIGTYIFLGFLFVIGVIYLGLQKKEMLVSLVNKFRKSNA